MAVKMRLQRHGKKGQPFYHIVVADGRAPRDGRFIEKLGTYNPLTKPAEITIDFDGALRWLRNGAQPTDTVRAILSYKGVMLMNHLMKGVAKGALTEEQAKAKFETWVKEKEGRINQEINQLKEGEKAEKTKRFAEEVKVKEQRAEAIAKRKADEVAAQAEAAAAEEANEEATEETSEEATEEAAE